jgi:hypothetical protein
MAVLEVKYDINIKFCIITFFSSVVMCWNFACFLYLYSDFRNML